MKEKTPKITVLMPVYNAERFLKEAIESILNQTFRDFEFSIINDGSTDNSKNIILSYQDPRIRYYENSKNLGVARTLNKGLRLTKGEYIARMDADDISLPDRLRLQYEAFNKDKNLVIVATCNEVIDENANLLEVWKNRMTPEDIYYTIQFKFCFAHPTVMFKKKIILEHFNGYDEEHEAEDYDLWLRVSKKHKIVKLDKLLVKLRINKGGRIGTFGEKINRDAFYTAKNNLQSMMGKPISDRVAKILTNYKSINPTPFDVKQALLVLQKLNERIIEDCPYFLNRSNVRRVSLKMEKLLRGKYILAVFRYSKLSPVINFLYKFYSPVKHLKKHILKFA